MNRGCIFFKHKEAKLTMDLEKEIQNGNLVIAYADGSFLKSEAIGKEYFRNNFESIKLPT